MAAARARAGRRLRGPGQAAGPGVASCSTPSAELARASGPPSAKWESRGQQSGRRFQPGAGHAAKKRSRTARRDCYLFADSRDSETQAGTDTQRWSGHCRGQPKQGLPEAAAAVPQSPPPRGSPCQALEGRPTSGEGHGAAGGLQGQGGRRHLRARQPPGLKRAPWLQATRSTEPRFPLSQKVGLGAEIIHSRFCGAHSPLAREGPSTGPPTSALPPPSLPSRWSRGCWRGFRAGTGPVCRAQNLPSHRWRPEKVSNLPQATQPAVVAVHTWWNQVVRTRRVGLAGSDRDSES